jgi:hypothetical protein
MDQIIIRLLIAGLALELLLAGSIFWIYWRAARRMKDRD